MEESSVETVATVEGGGGFGRGRGKGKLEIVAGGVRRDDAEGVGTGDVIRFIDLFVGFLT